VTAALATHGAAPPPQAAPSRAEVQLASFQVLERQPKASPRGFRHTVALSAPPAQPPIPFAESDARPELTVAQYAWVVATLRNTPIPEIPAALDRLRLTSETRRALDAKWNRRLADDRALAGEFAEALQKHGLSPDAITKPVPQEREDTGTIDLDSALERRGATVPFETAAPDELLPLTRYAQITALLRREGDPLATFKRLGMDAGEWLGIVRSYAKRFTSDPALEREFERLVKQGEGG